MVLGGASFHWKWLPSSKSAEAGLALQHIDDAEMYGNEEAIGQGIHESIKAGEVQRKDMFIVSKLGNNHHAAEAVLPAVQTSLSKLQLDYLDLYHIHWWVACKYMCLSNLHLPGTAIGLALQCFGLKLRHIITGRMSCIHRSFTLQRLIM